MDVLLIIALALFVLAMYFLYTRVIRPKNEGLNSGTGGRDTTNRQNLR